MYILRDYHEGINRFICSRTRPAFVKAWVLVVATLALVGVVFLFMGAPPINGIIADTSIFLDGSWRILNGQVPHRDFYTIFGDLPYYVTFLGMKLGRPGVSAIACGNIFVMTAAGLVAMFILRRRTSAFYACVFSLFIALMAITPRPLGDPHDYTGYAELYNRYGEASLALLGAILFLSPEPALKKSWADWLEAGFAGFCLPLLLFCKLNYFAVGIGFFVMACLRRRFPVQQTLFTLLSAAAFLALALFLTGIPVSAMLGDYRVMMAAQSGGERFLLLALQIVKGAFFIPILCLLALEISRKQDGQHSALSQFILFAFLYCCAVMLVASNGQQHELPLLALAALYGAEIIRRQTRLLTEDGLFIVVRNLLAALIFLFFVLPTLVPDFKTIRYSVRIARDGTGVTPETLRSTRLNDFRIEILGSRKGEMKEYMATVNEGMELLRRHLDPQTRLAVFLFSDPYQIALGLPPAGGLICLDSYELNQRSHPPLKKMLGNATCILTVRGCEEIKAAYGAEWDALHLQVIEETGNFTLLKVPDAPIH